MTDEAIRASIGLYNRSRALMRELYKIRREQPWLLSGDECLILYLIGRIPAP